MYNMRLIPLVLVLATGCLFYPGNGTPIDLTPQGSWSDSQLAAIDAAVAMWNTVGAGFGRGIKADQHMSLHLASLPWYDTDSTAACAYEAPEGAIYCKPSSILDGAVLAEFLAHELGHSIRLNHVEHGIMQPNLDVGHPYTELQPEDVAEYRRVY